MVGTSTSGNKTSLSSYPLGFHYHGCFPHRVEGNMGNSSISRQMVPTLQGTYQRSGATSHSVSPSEMGPPPPRPSCGPVRRQQNRDCIHSQGRGNTLSIAHVISMSAADIRGQMGHSTPPMLSSGYGKSGGRCFVQRSISEGMVHSAPPGLGALSTLGETESGSVCISDQCPPSSLFLSRPSRSPSPGIRCSATFMAVRPHV